MKDIGIIITETDDDDWSSEDVQWFTSAEDVRDYLVAEGLFEEVQES